MLILSTAVPKVVICIHAAATLVPVSGLGGGTCRLISPTGTVSAATNTLVELDSTNAKGYYSVLLAAGDNLTTGEWTLVYQTAATQANVGETRFMVNGPVDLQTILNTAVSTPATAGVLDINVKNWNNTVVATPATAGIPDINIKNVANTAVVASAGRIGTAAPLTKNVATTTYPFLMTDATNHTPATGKTVTCTRAIDAGAFGAGTLANVLEKGNGIYTVDFGAGDLNGSSVTLRATATGCDDTLVVINPGT